MRWGKCLTSLNFIYQFNQTVEESDKIRNVLILTFFPATEDSWSRLFKGGSEEQEKFARDFNFISLTNKNKKDKNKVNVFFGSFQQIYNGRKDKNSIFYSQEYELLILDEYHFGAYNSRAKSQMAAYEDIDSRDERVSNEVLSKLNVKYKLYLSGTPYKVLGTSGEINDADHYYTFTYFDEQRDVLENGENSDYKSCPRLNLYSVTIRKENVSDEDKIKFLFENKEIFNSHSNNDLFTNKTGASFWLIPSAKPKDVAQIEKLIRKYDTNNDFEVINLYNGSVKDTLGFVRASLDSNERKGKKSIILSYNKLTLGITEERIDNVVFLRDITTPELYMQAGCRAKSQYGKNKTQKKVAPIISFNINNDFSIFTTITNKKDISSERITEEEFIKLFPIYTLTYDSSTGETILKSVDSREKFLDALANVTIDDMIKNSVSFKVRTSLDIPADILEALNRISGIGSTKNFISNKEKERIAEEKDDPLKLARSKGRIQGRKDHENGLQYKIVQKYEEIKLQSEYENGYEIGYKEEFEPATEKELEARGDSICKVREKIELLIKRFIYILLADYYLEGKFYDIRDENNVSKEYFSSLLGFDRDMFIRLYDEYILDNSYVNNIVNTFRVRENTNTNYLGFADISDYEMIDESEISEKTISEKKSKAIEKIFDGVQDLVESEKQEEILDKKSLGQKYIYIAVPSTFMTNLIQLFNTSLNCIQINSQLYNSIIGYRDYFVELSRVIKIGETHRQPSERLEELNGYTRNISGQHLLFDIYKYVEVSEERSDSEFHKLLEASEYIRVSDDVRREIFEIQSEKAYELLKNYAEFGTLEKPEVQESIEDIDAKIAELLKRKNKMLGVSEINVDQTDEKQQQTIFYLKRKVSQMLVEASGYPEADGKFTLLKGSDFAVMKNGKVTKDAFTIYKELCKRGDIRNGKTQIDITFSSPSTAGYVVIGGPVNGQEAWKTEDGTILKEYLRNLK